MSSLSSSQVYKFGCILGSGGYGVVFHATEINSGKIVALKRSRVPQRVKRPMMQHESRVLQLLQGHSAIPVIYGYGHPPHFEYLAMELLGQDLKEICSGLAEDGKRILVKTSARIVEQALSALQHVHSKGIVHRDIKPRNFLCSLQDPSKILLVDFGISRPILPGPPKLKGSKIVIGTLDWASLNAHDSIDLAPRDDLESLAYTAFFLLRGGLPWIYETYRRESMKRSIVRTRNSKVAFSPIPSPKEPEEFAELLIYARKLFYEQIPDYDSLGKKFSNLADHLGSFPHEPLDWSPDPEGPPDLGGSHDEVDGLAPEEDDDDDSDDAGDDEDEDEYLTESYVGYDMADYEIQHNRDKEITLPIEQEELMDSLIPRIDDVINPNKIETGPIKRPPHRLI